MKPPRNVARGLALGVLAGFAGLAHALTVAELQALLQAQARPDARYEETRESPWLSSPIATRGTLRVTSQALEKRVEAPRQETWRMLEDRLEWQGPGGAGRKQILFSQAPALQALADVTRHAVDGGLVALERDFTIVISGDERVWSARLAPRTPMVSRQLDAVELQGTGGRLRVLIVTERKGERTTTRILP
jgi:hypothetical protein